MIKIIAAMSLDRAIGVYDNPRKTGRLPWKKFSAKGDLQHFQRLTRDGIVIMGRKTFQSIGKPLPDRKNIVVTSKAFEEVDTAPNLNAAIQIAKGFREAKNIWLIGGSRIFDEGQRFADEIILTLIPYKAYEHYKPNKLVYFPDIDTKIFKKRTASHHPINRSLRIIRYGR